MFGFHCAYLFTGFPRLLAALQLGYEGVPFFFVLSGFVLTWVHRPGDGALRFYWHRFARIWPVMTFLSLVIIVTDYSWTRQLAAVPDMLYSVSLLQAWTVDHFYAINTTAWTLSCEAFFYLLFPALIRLLRRLRPAALAAVLIVMDALSAGTRIWIAHHTYSPGVTRLVVASPLSLTPMFVVGICTALLVRRGWRPPVGARVSILLCLMAAAFCWGWLRHPEWFTAVKPGIGVFDAVLIPFFALMAAAVGLRDVRGGRSLLARPWLEFLGRISFAFYLVHYFVLDAFRHYGMLGHWSTAAVVPLLAAFGATLLAAWALHAGVERPAERLLRGLLPVREPVPTAAVQPSGQVLDRV
ncbi:acyltransferase family protein [Kitasatospora sp. McL0602]|uniref:acyltransferase family protein n=1 Tax=Kitasatospora sp. McL0602 TaxID=3439530 RepID=UPI003F89897A